MTLAEISPAPTGALERARALGDLVSSQAVASERLGRLTDEVADALLAGNLFAILVPERYGGLGGTRLDMFETAEEVARADGSAGWCVSVCNATMYAAYRGLPEQGRQEIFGDGPTACWVCLYPSAVSVAETGGYRVSGAWTFGSGSSFSRWVLVASPVRVEDGVPWYRAHLVPKAQVEIKDGSWDVMGLRATASLDYAITERFVPTHRTFEHAFSRRGTDGALSSLEGVQLNLIGLTAFASGVAKRAMEELLACAGKTKRVAAEGMQADDHTVQFGVGELDGRLRAARAHFVARVSGLDDCAAQGRAVGADEALEVHQAALTLARAAREAVVFAFDNAGTSIVYARHPLQRCLRDIFTGLKHASFTPAILGRVGKARLGVAATPPSFGESHATNR